MKKKRVLIFHIGSLGDTVIAMPTYREIARRHPDAERLLLTNFPIGAKMVQAEALLLPTGLIHGSIQYPMPLRGAANALALLKRLRALKIDTLYYLTAEKLVRNMVRHAAFFKVCGIRHLHAIPWTRARRYPQIRLPGKLWESEASRLLRNVNGRHKPGPPPPADRALDLTPGEIAAADTLLQGFPAEFVTLSVGGKVPVNDWGNTNWSRVLESLSAALPGLGLVLIGSADERPRNELLAQSWAGPTLNSCGLLTPRETAALIARARLFLGHDTGTLHLAAAADTPVLGIYSARNNPGKWFSDRPADTFFYNQPPCFGCEFELPALCPNNLVCMTRHDPAAVIEKAQTYLQPR